MTFDDALDDLRRFTSGARHAHTGTWIASALREQIAAGRLQPGAKLSEEALCEVLRVSRNTLREAFAMLANENIITRIPNRGVFVARPTAEDIREIYRVRRYVEPAALMWAPDPDYARLAAIVERARTARDAGLILGMASANQDFHNSLVALAGSSRLNDLMAQVLAEMRLVFYGMADDPAFHAPYVEDNGAIAQLLVQGERAQATDYLVDYLRRAEAQLLESHARAAG